MTTPTLWKDMTDAEKGALLLAHHEGRVVEYWEPYCESWSSQHQPLWTRHIAYRVRPEPKRETVRLHWGPGHLATPRRTDFDTHRFTFDLIDGDLPPGEYVNAEGHVITVEKL